MGSYAYQKRLGLRASSFAPSSDAARILANYDADYAPCDCATHIYVGVSCVAVEAPPGKDRRCLGCGRWFVEESYAAMRARLKRTGAKSKTGIKKRRVGIRLGGLN